MKSNTSIRVFENPILEAATHVHPLVPLILWAPLVVYLIYYARVHDRLSVAALSVLLIIGLVVWTFTEYAIHRWVFHFRPQSRLGKRFVFLFHGLHHDDPNDATRLVMPPVPAALIMCLLYALIVLICPEPYRHGFMAFFITGYLCYDYIHFATHHFRMSSPIGKFLRKYHLQHHFRNPDRQYGVSSPLWDFVFRTTARSR